MQDLNEFKGQNLKMCVLLIDSFIYSSIKLLDWYETEWEGEKVRGRGRI